MLTVSKLCFTIYRLSYHTTGWLLLDLFLAVSQSNAIFFVSYNGPFLISRTVRYVRRAQTTSKSHQCAPSRDAGLPTNHMNIHAMVRACSNGWALNPSRRYLRTAQYGAAATPSTCDIYSSACYTASVEEHAAETRGWEAQCCFLWASATKCMDLDAPHWH